MQYRTAVGEPNLFQRLTVAGLSCTVAIRPFTAG